MRWGAALVESSTIILSYYYDRFSLFPSYLDLIIEGGPSPDDISPPYLDLIIEGGPSPDGGSLSDGQEKDFEPTSVKQIHLVRKR